VDPSRYAELFLTESQEHLSAINTSLLELERTPGAEAPVAALFRAMHTIKGMAATMGYQAVTEIAHEAESLLDGVRRGAIRTDATVADLLFSSADLLERTIEATTEGHAPPDAHEILERMRAMTRAARATPPRSMASVRGGPVNGTRVTVTLEPDTPLKGVRAWMVAQKLATLGRLLATEPPEGALQAEQFERTFTVVLDSGAAPELLIAAARAGGYVEQAEVTAPGGASTAAEPEEAMLSRASQPVRRPSGAITAEFAVAAEATTTGSTKLQRHIRIDLRRLDTLMNLIGELVIARGRLQAIAAERKDVVLDEALAHASRLVSELQDEIMTSRLVPVWQVFDRFPRLVRDAARSLGKDVDFVIEGKDIELDRSMLDEIGEPVVHLLRNAVDHGLETPAERRAVGKPPSGRLRLSALRDRSSVLIRVSDDGKGIDRARVLAKAKRLGLVEPEVEELGDDELFRLIARPGFSTNETVTDLSGRGVGIDAVATRVRQLGGTLELRSEDGRGTTVTARLPATLAIVRAVLARVGGETYAVPMTHVSETLELPGDVRETVKGREVLSLRDDVLPLVHLRELVRLPRHRDRINHVIVLEMADRRAGVLVDRLLGQQDIVVKPFDAVKDGLALFSGATILGDGAPALILDVNSLL
jgi:two-component system chemotaxis sensor kinase CheA